MKKVWTIDAIDEYVDEKGGGCALVLLNSCFPFTKLDKMKIKQAMDDEDNYSDSDVCDLILDIAYARAEDNQ